MNSSLVAPSLAGDLHAKRGEEQFHRSGRAANSSPRERAVHLAERSIYGLGTWSADMAICKNAFEIAETKSFTLRVDARNVFNHPTPALSAGFFQPTGGAPVLDLTTARFLSALSAPNVRCPLRQFAKPFVPAKARVDF